MNPTERFEIIKLRLTNQFSPTNLEVIDDSHKHRGHAGSANGAGHYTVKIFANCFKDKSRVAVHREIYQVLSDLIPDEIHALCIETTFDSA